MQPYPPVSMPWWKSKIIVGAFISILMKALVIFGLTGELSDAETTEVIDLTLMAIGAIGDLVVIGSRVRQRHVPRITTRNDGGPGAAGSFPFAVLALMLLMPLASCATLPKPSAIAEGAKVDEQAALVTTLSYTAAARAAALAIETGVVRDPAAIRRIGELDREAYLRVELVECAYRLANAVTLSPEKATRCAEVVAAANIPYSAALKVAGDSVAKFLAGAQGGDR